jgi:hypothetical protein
MPVITAVVFTSGTSGEMTMADEMDNETAEPISEPMVQEVAAPAPVVVTPPLEGEVPDAPSGETDMAYRLGRLETRLVECEKYNERIASQLAAFEAATIAAVDEEQQQIEEQGRVVEEVAEEVLPEDNAAANALNPNHGEKKCSWWESLFGGCR